MNEAVAWSGVVTDEMLHVDVAKTNKQLSPQ